MIKSGTELLDLVYYDANGNPRFRRCCYTDSNGLNALAYPVHYCDGHTNRIYPNTDRTEWDVSTLQYKEDSPLCLGNKGSVMVFWPNGCDCFVSYNYGTSQFTDGANATVVDYYGTICLSLAKIADNSRYIYFVDNPYSRYRNGTVGYTDPSDYIRADDFVFYNRDFSLDTIVDELGNGQASGGSSHPYLSAELLLEIPTDFQGEVIADAPAHNQPTDNRPSLRFSDYINPYSQLDIHNRIRHDWTHNGRRFVLMDLLSKKMWFNQPFTLISSLLTSSSWIKFAPGQGRMPYATCSSITGLSIRFVLERPEHTDFNSRFYMKPIWISTEKVAELLGISERHVRRQLPLWEYEWQVENGKKVIKVNARSLPKEACDKYIEGLLPELSDVSRRNDDIDTVTRAYDRSCGRSKKNFDKWTLILLKCDGITGTKELGRFVDEWNRKHPEMKTSIKSIYRQRAAVDDCGKIALINHRETMKSTVSDAMFEDFKTAYLTANKISVFSCRMIALGKAMKRGEVADESEFPSASAFTRRLKTEFAPDVIYFAREGKKKFYDNKGYHLDRDYSDLKAGQVWVGDTRTWDVFVKVPGQEKPATCYITLFMDFKTYMPMGWCLHHDAPGTENTLRAIRNGIERYGLPEELYVDNGREYRNRDFSGQSRGNKIVEDEQYAESLASRLGIKMHFAIVRNARAKIIERNFLVIKGSLDKMFNSYKGGNVVEKPEPLKGVLKRGDFVTWEEFYNIAQDYMTNVFPGLPCFGKNHKGKTRAQLWNEEIVKREPMRRVSKDTLSMLVSRTVTGRIMHMGFHYAQMDTWYWAEWMPVYKGREVTFRYDPEDMRTAWCYDSEKKLIGECYLQSSVGAMVKDDDVVSKAQIAEGVARKRHEEKLLKEICPDMTKEQAAEYIDAMRTAVGPQDIFIPEGPTHITRHDKDSAQLKAEKKVGNGEIINMLGDDDDGETAEPESLWEELARHA